jgi:hypothetical protein
MRDYMSSDRIIVDALKLAHSLVGQNLRPATDAATTVLRLRALFHLPSVRAALERGSDSLPTFALREVARVLLIAISESRRPRRNSVRYPVNAG